MAETKVFQSERKNFQFIPKKIKNKCDKHFFSSSDISKDTIKQKKTRSKSLQKVDSLDYPLQVDSPPSKKDSLEFRSPDTKNNNEVKEPKHLYQIWPGKNLFCFCGKYMTGPAGDIKYTILTWGIIIIFTAIYCVLAVPVLLSSINLILPTFSLVLLMLSILFFFLTSCSDPGIIPRKEVFELFGGTPDRFSAKIFERGGNLRVMEEKNSILQYYKYCPTCRIFRPPRASHCAYV